MMRARLKRAVRTALLSPLGAPVASVYRGVATCLMYHRVAAGTCADARARGRFQPNLELFVAEEELDAQMRWLAREHDCLALPDAVDLLHRGKLPKRAAVVTFDDGYRDNLLALPILRQHRVPATIYVTTGAVGRTRTMWWDEQERILGCLSKLELEWRGGRLAWPLETQDQKAAAFNDLNRIFKSLPPPRQDELIELLRARAHDSGSEEPFFADESILSWEDVQTLDREPLITIGAHTVDHFVLSQLPAEELERQLRESRSALEERLGHPVLHFAYPFGGAEHAGGREFAAAAAAGFTSAVTTRPNHWRAASRHALHALPRLAIDFSDTMDDFRWKVSGLASAIHRPGSLFDAAPRE
jgi:peptidoglycan/xylan/chitin deacetylase (PgdA/CDA1 family)